jgi:hypothetical protein
VTTGASLRLRVEALALAAARRVPDLESHAWVSIDGRPCDPDSAAGYTAIWHLWPASGR